MQCRSGDKNREERKGKEGREAKLELEEVWICFQDGAVCTTAFGWFTIKGANGRALFRSSQVFLLDTILLKHERRTPSIPLFVLGNASNCLFCAHCEISHIGGFLQCLQLSLRCKEYYGVFQCGDLFDVGCWIPASIT
jgi:hypothetical protein